MVIELLNMGYDGRISVRSIIDLKISIVCLFVFVAWSLGSFGTCGSNKVSFYLCQEYNKLVERAVL
jgi:hypothetical protein